MTKALEADISVEHATKFMALVAVQTGARFSEIAGLTWDNSSYEMKAIRVEKAWDTINKNGFTTTKTSNLSELSR
ncbi:tyrosine-type recombinase/integrase [Secundilactobacillus kimchicus]|uniref:tyrosine-type recombinase/integrase n=1 Tax=Secundilactobacillus kimchicus TaxID=528209 RepID=UPI0024A8CB78|nr:tyrosine-type recombinase/integrase [Secundilactobacillus kimchicus]